VPSEQSWQRVTRHTPGERNGVEILDLARPDQQGPTHERQAAEDGHPAAEGEGAHGVETFILQHSNQRIGASTTAIGGSRESTVTVTGDGAMTTAAGTSRDLPTLEKLFSKVKAMRRTAVAKLGQELKCLLTGVAGPQWKHEGRSFRQRRSRWT